MHCAKFIIKSNFYALTDLPILLNIREQTWLIAQAPSFTLVILLMWKELGSIKMKSHNIG